MTALRKIQPEPLVATTARIPTRKLSLVTSTVSAEPKVMAAETKENTLKNVVLFFAAPFIGLAYIIALPFVGLGILAVLTARAAGKFETVKTAVLVLKYLGMLVAAPVLGLGYVIFFPLLGLGALAWIGGRAIVGAERKT